jgi:hypothetical protein
MLDNFPEQKQVGVKRGRQGDGTMMKKLKTLDFVGGADADRTRDLLNAIGTARTFWISARKYLVFSNSWLSRHD